MTRQTGSIGGSAGGFSPPQINSLEDTGLSQLWLQDLIWRDGRWLVNLDSVFETAWKLTLARAKRERNEGIIGPHTEAVIRQLQRGYRILLSRAIHGVFVWFEDEETRQHVLSTL